MIQVFSTLNNVMNDQDLSIKEVQEETKLSRTTISNLINHKSAGIQFETLSLLCGALNCSPGDLLIKHHIDLQYTTKTHEITDITNNTEPFPEGDQRYTKLANFDIHCTFILDNQKYNIDFKLESIFWFAGEYFGIDEYIPSILFKQFLNENNFPYYIKDYLTNELRTFFNGQIMEIFSKQN